MVIHTTSIAVNGHTQANHTSKPHKQSTTQAVKASMASNAFEVAKQRHGGAPQVIDESTTVVGFSGFIDNVVGEIPESAWAPHGTAEDLERKIIDLVYRSTDTADPVPTIDSEEAPGSMWPRSELGLFNARWCALPKHVLAPHGTYLNLEQKVMDLVYKSSSAPATTATPKVTTPASRAALNALIAEIEAEQKALP